jgi:hypothetical protein
MLRETLSGYCKRVGPNKESKYFDPIHKCPVTSIMKDDGNRIKIHVLTIICTVGPKYSTFGRLVSNNQSRNSKSSINKSFSIPGNEAVVLNIVCE